MCKCLYQLKQLFVKEWSRKPRFQSFGHQTPSNQAIKVKRIWWTTEAETFNDPTMLRLSNNRTFGTAADVRTMRKRHSSRCQDGNYGQKKSAIMGKSGCQLWASQELGQILFAVETDDQHCRLEHWRHFCVNSCARKHFEKNSGARALSCKSNQEWNWVQDEYASY